MEGGERGELPAAAYYVPRDDEVSILQFLSVLLKHRYAIVGWSFLAAFLVALVTVLSPRSYTASGSFVPQAVEGTGGAAAALAGQLGISLPGGGTDPSESPEFYSDLVLSREILGRVLDDTFSAAQVRRGDTVNTSGTLLDLLEIERPTESRRKESGLRWLRDQISTSVARETGVVRVSVTTPWPGVSESIGRRLLDLVNGFNRATRQTQAAAERAFLEERIVEAEDSLRAAENQLRVFLEANRGFQNSPALVFEHERLQRRVAMRQQLFTSLSLAYANARIAEVRNTPLITVVEPPARPVLPDPRRLALRGMVALMLGGMVGIGFAFTYEFLARSREEGDEGYRAFHHVWDETVGDLRRLFRRAKA